MTDFSIPVELKQAIIDNKLVAFVGAGLSYDLYNINGQQIKGWPNLVNNLLKYLKDKGHYVDPLIPLTEMYDPIIVLDLIEKADKLPKAEMYSFMKDYFDLDNEKNDFTIHKKISSLCNKIITTNYDDSFIIADRILGKYTAFKGTNFELTKNKDSRAKVLFKLHGCFRHSDSMVLFPTNYNDLYHCTDKDAEHSLHALKNLVYNNTVLFIGCGMGDYQINNIFSAIKNLQGDYNQKHFIITNKPLDSKLNFLTPIYIQKFSEIDSILNNLIEAKSENEPLDQEKYEKLKCELEEANKRITVLEKSVPSEDELNRKERLLEREALKYFTRGLEYQLTNEYEKAINEYEVCLELDPDTYEALINWGIILGDYAKHKPVVEAEMLYLLAFEKYEKAFEMNPDDYEILSYWGYTLGDYAELKTGKEAEVLYLSAFEKYEKALEMNPDDYEALSNWGYTLGDYAELKTGKEAEALYLSACEKYEKALEMNPDDYDALINWGYTLGDYANVLEGSQAEKLYLSACDKFEKAIAISPDNYRALIIWGYTLVKYADLITGKEAEALYLLACEKYKKIIEVHSEDYEVLNYWGCTLTKYAKLKTDKEAEVLYLSACKKYEKALEKKPDSHEVLNNWGVALIALAKLKNEDLRNKLLLEAREILLKSVKLKSSYYNYACVNALLNEKQIAFNYLSKSLSENHITTEHVLIDEDWNSFKSEAEFIEIIQLYKKV